MLLICINEVRESPPFFQRLLARPYSSQGSDALASDWMMISLDLILLFVGHTGYTTFADVLSRFWVKSRVLLGNEMCFFSDCNSIPLVLIVSEFHLVQPCSF